MSSVQPPGPRLKHARRAAEGEIDQYGDQRNLSRLRPGAEIWVPTDLGVSERIRAGPLASPGLPSTLHICHWAVRQTGWRPLTAPERNKVASAVAA